MRSVTAQATNLSDRVRLVGQSLESAFGRLVAEVEGPAVRPAQLARVLGVDKTLAGKLLRAVRAGDALLCVWEIPAPQGLSIVLGAAERQGAAGPALEAAREAMRAYEVLLSSVSGGRAGLEAALTGWIPEVRGRAERIARQTAFRSTAYLMGYQADCLFHSYILHPAAGESDVCDAVALTGSIGLRRLRHGHPITVFGMHLGQDHAAPPSGASRMELLSGAPLSDNPEDYLLREFCSEAPPLQVYRHGPVARWALPGDEPPIDEPISLVRGVVGRGEVHRYRAEGVREEFFGTVSRTPHKVLIKDVFIHEDLFPGVTPVVTTKLQGFVYEGLTRRDPMSVLDRVDMAVQVEPLGERLEGFAAREIPRYVEMLRRAIERVDWDPSKFRGYRCRMMYPMQSLETVMWLDLPARPQA